MFTDSHALPNLPEERRLRPRASASQMDVIVAVAAMNDYQVDIREGEVLVDTVRSFVATAIASSI